MTYYGTEITYSKSYRGHSMIQLSKKKHIRNENKKLWRFMKTSNRCSEKVNCCSLGIFWSDILTFGKEQKNSFLCEIA